MSVVVGEGRRRKALLLKPRRLSARRATAALPPAASGCRRISNSLFVASYTETALYLAKLCCHCLATTAIWIRTLDLANTSAINYPVITKISYFQFEKFYETFFKV